MKTISCKSVKKVNKQLTKMKTNFWIYWCNFGNFLARIFIWEILSSFHFRYFRVFQCNIRLQKNNVHWLSQKSLQLIKIFSLQSLEGWKNVLWTVNYSYALMRETFSWQVSPRGLSLTQSLLKLCFIIDFSPFLSLDWNDLVFKNKMRTHFSILWNLSMACERFSLSSSLYFFFHSSPLQGTKQSLLQRRMEQSWDEDGEKRRL